MLPLRMNTCTFDRVEANELSGLGAAGGSGASCGPLEVFEVMRNEAMCDCPLWRLLDHAFDVQALAGHVKWNRVLFIIDAHPFQIGAVSLVCSQVDRAREASKYEHPSGCLFEMRGCADDGAAREWRPRRAGRKKDVDAVSVKHSFDALG